MKSLRLVFYAHNFDRLMRALAHFPDVRTIGADHFREILAVHFWDGARLGHQLLHVGLHRRDHATHDAVVAQVTNEGARVNVGQHRNLELLEILFGNLLRAPVGADS